MIGLAFLAVGLLWLALAVYLSAKLPLWLGINKLLWPARAGIFALLLVGPFVDEIVGMKQFKKLCEEWTIPRIADDAESVRRAKRAFSKPQLLKGFAINIESQTVMFTEASTGKVFLAYEYFKTKGGRIAGIAMMEGWHSCSVESATNKDFARIRSISAYQKIVNGE